MEANTRNLERIFDQTIAYQIPLFQRPYVWNENDNWQPLWEDILSLLDKQLTHSVSHPHFLGAIVLEQVSNVTGSIEARQVIDGQQRLITLQLFLIAVRDYCASLSDDKYLERFTDFTANKESRIDQITERYKVWPTNCDRDNFATTHGAGSISSLLEKFSAKGKKRIGKKIPDAYLYFSERLSEWFTGVSQDEEDTNEYTQEVRLEALWQVARNHLQLVVIDLDKDDEPQVIFETLNARGTQLLPADLVKNYLFRKAENANEPVEQLYNSYWKSFDTDFWREEVKQGRVKRPRIDLFLQHYLSLKTLDDVRVTHLFNAFKQYAQNGSTIDDVNDEVLTTPGEQLKSLNKYGRIFETFYNPEAKSRLAVFLDRLAAVDTATVYPFLLEACYTLTEKHVDELNRILVWLESFLIRRMICGLTSKNYNKLFIDLVKASVLENRVSEDKVVDFLLKGEGESNRFPNDEDFKSAWLLNPSYQRLAQYKIRAVLGALDVELETAKSEDLSLPSGLTIEHVLPVSWENYWPLELDDPEDPIEKQQAKEYRDNVLHSFGNLTLITGSLNPSLSNGAWADKQPALIKYSKLNLNRYFHDRKYWNEDMINERGNTLFDIALKIWPYPQRAEK